MRVHGDFAAAFASAQFVSRAGGRVQTHVRRIGGLSLPSGQIAVLDPNNVDAALALGLRVPPGIYPVDVCLSGNSVACVRVRFGPREAEHWTLTYPVGADAPTAGAESAGCAIGAMGCLAVTDWTTVEEMGRTEPPTSAPPPEVAADPERLVLWSIQQDATARRPALECITEHLTAEGFTAACLTLPGGGESAIVETGGSGIVYTYWGVASDDRVVELVVDVDPLVENDWEEAVVSVPPVAGDLHLPGRLAQAGRIEVVASSPHVRLRVYRGEGRLDLRDFSRRQSLSERNFDEYEYPPGTSSLRVLGFFGLVPLTPVRGQVT
jgi:hypothetical protein